MILKSLKENKYVFDMCLWYLTLNYSKSFIKRKMRKIILRIN